MSATSGTSADGAISSGVEILGAGAPGTISSDSASASDVDLKANAGDVWWNSTANRVNLADAYLYVINAGTGNGTTNSSAGTLTIFVECLGVDV